MGSEVHLKNNRAKGREAVAPRFITARLGQIDLPEVHKELVWATQCGYRSSLVPTVTPSGLKLLQHTNPMVVTRTRNETRSGSAEKKEPESRRMFVLLAGRRTYQLHREQLSETARVQVLQISDPSLPGDPELYDLLVQRLLFAPDDLAIDLIASQLHKHPTLRARASTYFPVSSVADVSALLGMSRQTLHRTLERTISLTDELSSVPTTRRAGIRLLNDEPGSDD